MAVILALQSQRQENCHKFEANLVYIMGSETTYQDPFQKKKVTVFVYVVYMLCRRKEGGAGHQLRTSGTPLVPHGGMVFPSLWDLDSSQTSLWLVDYHSPGS